MKKLSIDAQESTRHTMRVNLQKLAAEHGITVEITPTNDDGDCDLNFSFVGGYDQAFTDGVDGLLSFLDYNNLETSEMLYAVDEVHTRIMITRAFSTLSYIDRGKL